MLFNWAHSTPFPKSILFYLPLPPILGLIYQLIGHSILRSQEEPFISIPLLSSVRIGATGGAIVAVPFSLASYILLIRRRPPERDDFFDDHSSTAVFGDGVRAGQVGVGVLFAFLGTLAGALGAAVLPHLGFSSGQGATAGTVGGIIFAASFIVIAVTGGLVLNCILGEEGPSMF
ncbi:hypothetical protein C8J56DRAFT_296514 [Mycena floridula]|nr:hypothetical protein C8J56DRAFT_296514 [Mycena floridula]